MVSQLISQSLSSQCQLYESKMLDALINKAQDQIMRRILHEIFCLFDIDMQLNIASNTINEHLVSAIVDSYI
jgi:hypothetical protein